MLFIIFMINIEQELIMTSKSLLKKVWCISTLWLLFVLSACISSRTLSSVVVFPTATITPSSTAIPTEEDLAAQKQRIWDEFVQQVNAYNNLVEQEKSLGNIQISHNNATGQDQFIFTGESDQKIRAAFAELIGQFQVLSEQYMALYKKDYNPTPFPTFSTKEDALNFYRQAIQEDNDWMDEQRAAETSLKIYNPDRGTYQGYLTFEQDSWFLLKNQALSELRMNAELTPEIQAKNKMLVEALDGGDVVSSEIDARPWYRNDLTLFQYKTQKNYYVLNADGAIIDITPVDQSGNTQLVIPGSQPASDMSFTQGQLEQQARAWVNLIAPGTNLDALTPSVNSKTDNYFFKWEDQTKPPLDGGGFPFVQVTLNVNGDLLQYINTLPLARQ